MPPAAEQPGMSELQALLQQIGSAEGLRSDAIREARRALLKAGVSDPADLAQFKDTEWRRLKVKQSIKRQLQLRFGAVPEEPPGGFDDRDADADWSGAEAGDGAAAAMWANLERQQAFEATSALTVLAGNCRKERRQDGRMLRFAAEAVRPGSGAEIVARVYKYLHSLAPFNGLKLQAFVRVAKKNVRDVIACRVQRLWWPRTRQELVVGFSWAFGGQLNGSDKGALLKAHKEMAQLAGGGVDEAVLKPMARRSRSKQQKPPQWPATIPEGDMIQAPLKVRRTFFDDTSSQTTTSKVALTEPRDFKPYGEFTDSAVWVNDHEYLETAAARQPPELRLCDECSSEDPDGWENWVCEFTEGGEKIWRLGFWCKKCWSQWLLIETAEAVDTPMDKPGEAGSHSTAFEHLDPIADSSRLERYNTKVRVVRKHCVDAVKDYPDACLVAFGSLFYIKPRWLEAYDGRGLLWALGSASNFLALACHDDALLVPKWGGIEARQVEFSRSSSQEEVVPHIVSGVYYAANPWGPATGKDEAINTFRDIFRYKILNVFRQVHLSGFTGHIVIGSRFSELPHQLVAEVFQEVLYSEASDTRGLFREVTFSFDPADDCTSELYATFQKTFGLAVAGPI